MSIYKKVLEKIKRIFSRNNKNIMIESKSKDVHSNNSEFMTNLKSGVKDVEKKKVETLVCVGDGLGINKITY